MLDPWIIHRNGRVSDRETGEVCGRVDRVEAFPGLWTYRPTGHVGRPFGGWGDRQEAARLLWERWERERKGVRDG